MPPRKKSTSTRKPTKPRAGKPPTPTGPVAPALKILHTGDWHLGKRLMEVSRLDEQRAVLDEIAAIADREAVDAVLVAGDLFDAINPPTEAEELLYRTLKRLGQGGRRAVIAIAGNHDSPGRVEITDPLARECGIFFAGFPHTTIAPIALDSGLAVTRSEPGFIEVKFPRSDAPPLRLIATAYANEYRLKTWLGAENPEAALRETLESWWARLAKEHCGADGVNMLIAHLFVAADEGSELAEPEDEKPILLIGGAQAVFARNLPPGLQYAALGHLHRAHAVAETPAPMVYSGSPLAYSFSEAGQKKHVVIVEAAADGHPASWRLVPLTQGRPLHRKTFSLVDEAVEWLSAHQDGLIELTMKTEGFLTGADRRRLNEAHPGIVQIIPIVTKSADGDEDAGDGPVIDPHGGIEELFERYFVHRHGQPPSESIMGLLREAIASDDAPADDDDLEDADDAAEAQAGGEDAS